jgi:hypothetical protein
MKIKTCPTIPTRQFNIVKEYEINSGDYLGDLFNKYPTGWIHIEYSYDDTDISIRQLEDEPVEEYRKRYEKYLVDKAEYDEWYASNKEVVLQYLQRKEQAKENRKIQNLKKKQEQIERLKKEIQKLEDKL